MQKLLRELFSRYFKAHRVAGVHQNTMVTTCFQNFSWVRSCVIKNIDLLPQPTNPNPNPSRRNKISAQCLTSPPIENSAVASIENSIEKYQYFPKYRYCLKSSIVTWRKYRNCETLEVNQLRLYITYHRRMDVLFCHYVQISWPNLTSSKSILGNGQVYRVDV